jgi:site-specific DNA-methyltransferase (adenine-specific)
MSVGMPYDRGVRKPTVSACYGSYEPVRILSNGQRYPHDVLFYEEAPPDWLYCKTAENEGKTCHPSQKPVALGRYLIRTFSNPGDIVLDNACGSGSFLVAAIREQRQFIGMEKNEHSFLLKTEFTDFIRSCRARINNELLQQKLI